MPHNAGCKRRADTLDGAGTKITLHRNLVLRCCHTELLDAKLLPIDRMINIGSLRLDALPLI